MSCPRSRLPPAKRPENRPGIKITVYQGVALALLYGPQGRRGRIEAEPDSTLAKDQAVVTITLRDGRGVSFRVEHAVGSLVNPMSDADLDDKFRGLCGEALPKDKIEKLLALCRDCEDLTDARVIAAAAQA